MGSRRRVMRRHLYGLLAVALAITAASVAFKHVASAPAANLGDPATASLHAANVDPATVENGTTTDGTAIFYAKRTDGALCAGFGEAVLCPAAGKTDLFADSPVVTVTVSKLIGHERNGEPLFGPTQRVIAFVRTDVATVAITRPDGTTDQLAVQDHSFEYVGAIASIRATNAAGHALGATTVGGSANG
jgi:hypothetical protein